MSEDDWTRQSDKQYPKSRFVYDPGSDSYTCPAGARLTSKDRCHGKHPRDQWSRYATPACHSCAERARFTRSEAGVQIRGEPSSRFTAVSDFDVPPQRF